MKKRIKIDSSLLSSIIIITGIMFLFRNIYPSSQFNDNVLDFFGLIAILKGNMWRMFARGHKKMHSKQGGILVTSGPYTTVRNPMYLGSFLIGVGFVLLVWPWWSLPIFALLFYVRFNMQMVKEEGILEELFDKEYKTYCKKVPRIFPSWRNLTKIRTKEIFNLKEAFSTKEKRGLWGWPLFALVLETLQQSIVFGYTDVRQTIIVFMSAIVVFALGFGVLYQTQ